MALKIVPTLEITDPKPTKEWLDSFGLMLRRTYEQMAITINEMDDIDTDHESRIAVLEALPTAAYTIQMYHDKALSPVGSTTYYFGGFASQLVNTGQIGEVVVPKTGTLVAWRLSVRVGTIGSGEIVNYFVGIVGGADVLNIQTSLDINNVRASATGSQALSAGDIIRIKFNTPAWVTNPLNIHHSVILFIEY